MQVRLARFGLLREQTEGGRRFDGHADREGVGGVRGGWIVRWVVGVGGEGLGEGGGGAVGMGGGEGPRGRPGVGMGDGVLGGARGRGA